MTAKLSSIMLGFKLGFIKLGSVTSSPNYRWFVIGLWLLSSVSGFMVIYTLGIFLPVISHDLDLSPGEQGLLGSASHWGNIALSIPLTLWTSRFGAKNLTAVTLTLAAACLFIQGWAPGFAVLLFGRLAFGVTIIAAQPARAFLTHQWFEAREIIMVNGLSNVLFGIVVGGGLIASPFILDAFGNDWRSTFRVFGIMFVVFTALWLLLGKERVREESPQPGTGGTGVLRGSLGYRDLWLCGFGFLGATMAFSAFVSFYPTLMLEDYDMSLRWSGAILALGVFAGGVTGLGIGYMAARKSKERSYLIVLGFLMAGSYVLMLGTSSISILMLVSFFNGLSWGFFPILITVPFLLPGIRPREMAVALSFTIMVTSLGTSLGPLITGYVQEATGDLKLSLLILSFPALSLCVAGATIRFNPAAKLASEPSTVG